MNNDIEGKSLACHNEFMNILKCRLTGYRNIYPLKSPDFFSFNDLDKIHDSHHERKNISIDWKN